MHYAREVGQYEQRTSQTRLLASLHEREGESYLSLLPAEIVACVNQHALPPVPTHQPGQWHRISDCGGVLRWPRQTAPAQVKYALPDGRTLVVDEEQVQCAEPLFKPSLLLLDPGEAHDHNQDARAPPRTMPVRTAKQREDQDEDHEEKGGLGALAKAARDSGPLKMRNEMSANVILTGGTSMFPGPLQMCRVVGRDVTGRGTDFEVGAAGQEWRRG
jgi:hypothetical protein